MCASYSLGYTDALGRLALFTFLLQAAAAYKMPGVDHVLLLFQISALQSRSSFYLYGVCALGGTIATL
jgi:hypothetical protein